VRGLLGMVAEDRSIKGSSVGEANPSSTALLEAHIPGLRRFACALLRGNQQHADDLVQDSLERALSNWHRRRLEADLRSWVYTIVYNRFLTEKRRQRRYAAYHPLAECLDQDLPGVDGGQGSALIQRDLLRGFAELPQEQRAVLLLVGVEDFSYKHAARILGVPIGTVMSRLSRGRERLRQYMNGDCANPGASLPRSHGNKPAAGVNRCGWRGLTHWVALVM
jgi:RNA polymerase sigma-70 factor (ECF subfamily)